MRCGPPDGVCTGVYFTTTVHRNIQTTFKDPNFRTRVNQATIYHNTDHIQTMLQTVHKPCSNHTTNHSQTILQTIRMCISIILYRLSQTIQTGLSW